MFNARHVSYIHSDELYRSLVAHKLNQKKEREINIQMIIMLKWKLSLNCNRPERREEKERYKLIKWNWEETKSRQYKKKMIKLFWY